MTNIKLHNDCKILSQAVYRNNLGKIINGWKCIKNKYYSNGYYVEAYKKDNMIIVVSRGTEWESLKDLYNDFNLVSRNLPSQIDSAKTFLKEVKENYKYENYNYTLTGHSLGGSISQALGSETGLETVTFSTYGIGNIMDKRLKYANNITNYGSEKDAIFMSNIDNQIGKTMILPSKINNNDNLYILKDSEGYLPKYDGLKSHKLENYEDLSTAKEYKSFKKGNEHKDIPLFKLSIQENVDLSEQDKKIERYRKEKELFAPENRVFYDGEMNPAKVPYGSDEDKYVPALLKQFSDNGNKLPKESVLKQMVNNGELIYVNDYVRQDGTHVSGYYRHK